MPLQLIAAIIFTTGMLLLCIAQVRGAIISRRAVKWQQALVEKAVERRMEHLYAALDDSGSEASE